MFRYLDYILFSSLILLLCACSGNTGYLEPQWKCDSKSSAYVDSIGFSSFFESIRPDSLYSRFFIEFVHFEEGKDYLEYANQQFKLNCKQTGYSLIYVIFNTCPNNRLVLTLASGSEKRILCDVLPGDLCRLEYFKDQKPISFLQELSLHREKSIAVYDSSSWIRKSGFDNPLLESIDLAMNPVCLPGRSLVYKVLFFPPFAVGMVLVFATKSLYCAIVIALLFALWFSFNWLRRKYHTDNKAERIYWFIGFLFFTIVFTLLINTVYPSTELLMRLRFYGYSYMTDVFYKSYYYSFSHSSSVSSIIIVVLISVFFLIYKFLSPQIANEQDSSSDIDVSEVTIQLVAIIAATYACGNRLSLVVLGYYCLLLLLRAYPIFTSNQRKVYSNVAFLVSLYLVWILVATAFSLYSYSPEYSEGAGPTVLLVAFVVLLPFTIASLYGIVAWYYLIKAVGNKKSNQSALAESRMSFIALIDLYEYVNKESKRLETVILIICLISTLVLVLLLIGIALSYLLA